jgi:hypothetical protein
MTFSLSNWTFRDLLFCLHLYRGASIECSELISCKVTEGVSPIVAYHYALPAEHRLTRWLLYECGGLWRIVVRRPTALRQVALCFARAEDAAIFQLLHD